MCFRRAPRPCFFLSLLRRAFVVVVRGDDVGHALSRTAVRETSLAHARLPHRTVLAGHRDHHVSLTESAEYGAANIGVIERWMQMVEAEHRVVAKSVNDVDCYVGLLASLMVG